jgi:hypothetical protein
MGTYRHPADRLEEGHVKMKSQPGFAPARILIMGVGDLGVRIAQLIVEGGYSSACMLAGHSGTAKQWAQLFRLTSGRDVYGAQLDGQDPDAVSALLAEFEPDLVVQCGTLLSPYALRGMRSDMAAAVLRGGFALQVAAQLPVIRAVMQARHALGMTCPVINCSYPDVTNAMLAAEGLAPDAGIGNVAIMALRFQRLLNVTPDDTFQVIGHHAQLGPSLAGKAASVASPVPLVYLNGRKMTAYELLIDTGLLGGPTLNHLAAATVPPILTGFLYRDGSVDTHSPGVFGLPGGYPVRFSDGQLELRLPDGLTREDAVAFNVKAGAAEGIERIGEDGTLVYSDSAKQAMAPFCPELAEPLRAKDIGSRLELLRSIARG